VREAIHTDVGCEQGLDCTADTHKIGKLEDAVAACKQHNHAEPGEQHTEV